MAKKIQITNERQSQAEESIRKIAKTIDYYVSEYTIEVILSKYKKKELFIPAYQRNFTWDKARQSKFIESILMDLPIPFLFFWQNEDTGTLEIVDGSQRIRTIDAFVNDLLILEDLEQLDVLNGFTYSNLKESRQRIFFNKTIRGIILGKNTSNKSRFDLFERINTGSKIASPAEIRKGALPGKFMDLVQELSNDSYIVKMLPANKKRENEIEREELITRFFAYSDGLENYKNSPSSFIYSYVNKMNKVFSKNNKLKQQYKKRIVDVFKFVEKYFPNGFKKTSKAGTLPRVRFESISLGVYNALQEDPHLAPTKELIARLLKSKDFENEVRSDGANTKGRLLARLEVTQNILLEKE